MVEHCRSLSFCQIGISITSGVHFMRVTGLSNGNNAAISISCLCFCCSTLFIEGQM